jgi:hypothetical protein
MTTPPPEQPVSLFSDQSLVAFEQGMAANLVTDRNPNLGNLLVTERAPLYVTILYRLLLFKREHELEPLYEDIFQAVEQPLTILENSEYHPDRFRTDLDQLVSWQLISSRIEKQRLRGYRDNRKRKYRYRLSDEAAGLLRWLEERLQDDLEERGSDTRDLLGEICGTLGELLRLLHHLQLAGEGQEDAARRIIFQLGKADDLCLAVTEGLIDLNGRLLAFLLQKYRADEVRAIISELDHYVDIFLKQAFSLRREIVPLLARLHGDKKEEKIRFAFTIMEKERQRTPHLLQVRRETVALTIPERLHRFFEDQGGLDQLLRRINESSLQVWLKLRSHLQELERKNHRLEDLGDRISEIAALDEDTIPYAFFEQLLSSGQGYFDLHYWDSLEKADPPQPIRAVRKKEKIIRAYLGDKKKTGTAVQSMEEARLQELEQWLRQKVMPPPAAGRVSQGNFSEFADFSRIMELAAAGILDNGKKLDRLSLMLKMDESRNRLSFAHACLDLPELRVKEKDPKEGT